MLDLDSNAYPVSILYKSIVGRYRPVMVADRPITARYRFIKKASWVRIFKGNYLIITKTRLCIFDPPPLKTQLLYRKMGFTGVYIIFLISAIKHRLWAPVRTVWMRWFQRVPTISVSSKNNKNITFLHLKLFPAIKGAIILNGRRFVIIMNMHVTCTH